MVPAALEPHGDPAAVRHGLRGVEAQVADDLVDLALSGGDEDGLAGRGGAQLDPRAQGMPAEIERGGNGGAEVDRDARRPLAAAEGQDLGAELSPAPTCAHDAAERRA